MGTFLRGLMVAAAILTIAVFIGLLQIYHIDWVNYPAQPTPGLPQPQDQTRALVIFRSCFCGPSTSPGGELSRLNQNARLFERAGVSVLAMTAGDPERVKILGENLRLGYPVAGVDPAVIMAYKAYNSVVNESVPANFIIGKDNRVHFEHYGRHGADWTPPWLVLVLAKFTDLIS